MLPALAYANEKRPEILRLIRALVECESPTDSPDSVSKFVELLRESTSDIAVSQIIRADGFGPHLRLEFNVGPPKMAAQVLGLGHSDTVWPLGTLRTMPFRLGLA